MHHGDFAERVTTRAADGTILSAGVVRPPGRPRGVVLAGHAMMADARTLDRPSGQGLASVLAEAGLLVVAADFRGHGRSGIRAGQGGQWRYDHLVNQDFPALLQLARDLAPSSPCAVVGHSLMGHVAAAYLGQHPDTPVRGLVTLSSNLWMMATETDPVRWLRKSIDIGVIEVLVYLLGHFPARRLRMGSNDESRGYMEQLCATYWRSRWCSVDGTVDYHANLANLRAPVLAIMGKGESYWCTAESMRAFYDPIAPERLSLWQVGQGDHGLTWDPGHMDIITDARSAPLWRALGDWVVEHLFQ